METIKIIFYAVLIIIFFVLPIITLLIRLFQKPFKRFSRGVPEPPKKLRDRYNDEINKMKEYRKTNDFPPITSSGAIGSPEWLSKPAYLENPTINDQIQILEGLGLSPDLLGNDKRYEEGFDGGFGGGGFSGSGASASWSDDNSSSYSSSYDSSSSSSSDSSSYDSSSSGSDY
ncbi:hypothetical protein G6N05_05305 [Flavobacterium sp. F372]|uniref:DUF4834 family protein n=1 Tax=Flavobacterium bernardetii TaxID=2813823 RepID=A0ABR7J1K8_9FLAO|nr:hypothetical protein [Flavobacterium bernardetii]MBC5835797.1 hypothetical protein [Flavobacterium bernardetii]NHF69528.1 hypothetical protein [Flavobacterium bernardetii]